MKKKLLLGFIFIVILSLDQFSKVHVEESLMIHHNPDNLRDYRGHHITVIDNFFYISYVRNQGAAWGIGSTMSDKYRDPFFYTMTFLSILFVLFYLYKTKPQENGLRFCLVLILSGAIGNFTDRIRLHYVIDFLDFSFWGWHFPSFNVADSSISIGISLLLVIFLIEEIRAHKQKKSVNNDASNPV